MSRFPLPSPINDIIHAKFHVQTRRLYFLYSSKFILGGLIVSFVTKYLKIFKISLNLRFINFNF